MDVEKSQQSPASAILDVAIVGAGIAGLTAAIGLCRAGHQVDVFERSRFANEVGAAIHVCPNATKLLTRWGFDFARANAVLVQKGQVISGTTLESSYSATYETLVERCGAPWYFLHRVDLHNELKRLAQTPGEAYPGARIHLSSEVIDVDCELGTVTLADGTVHKNDLIVAADGIHSTIEPKVTGFDATATATGQSAFRFLIPTEKLNPSASKDSIFHPDPAVMTVAANPERRLVFYPCRNGRLQNFVAIHPDRRQNETEGWNIAASVEDLLDEYKDFHPTLVEACKKAEDLKLWKLLYRKPNATWVKGKVALAGDAAHPMLPHQGQGGAQSIEDGAALGTLFTNLLSKDVIPERLFMYQEVRRSRAAAMQIFSNAGQDEAEKMQEEARIYVQGPIPKNQAEFHQFNFSHDVMAACKDMMAKA